MKLIYKTKKVEECCNNSKSATRNYGSEIGKKLIDLIVALESAPCLYDISRLPQYRLHALKGKRKNQYTITIHRSSKYRLIIYPMDEDGNILKSMENEKELLVKTLMIEIVEVSEHYE